MIDRDKLSVAFKEMRKNGLIARQNFKCCQSCAGYGLATEVEEAPAKKRAKIKGCVYYHAQDAADLHKGEDLYLAFGPLETEKHGTVGLPTVEVGRIAVACLTNAGLDVEWDGTERTRILVLAHPPAAPESEEDAAYRLACRS